jgi:hypothetical protein
MSIINEFSKVFYISMGLHYTCPQRHILSNPYNKDNLLAHQNTFKVWTLIMFELQPAFAVSLIFLPNAIEPGIQETTTPQGSIY